MMCSLQAGLCTALHHPHCVVDDTSSPTLCGGWHSIAPTVWWMTQLHPHCVVDDTASPTLCGGWYSIAPTVWWMTQLHPHCVVDDIASPTLCDGWHSNTHTMWLLTQHHSYIPVDDTALRTQRWMAHHHPPYHVCSISWRKRTTNSKDISVPAWDDVTVGKSGLWWRYRG